MRAMPVLSAPPWLGVFQSVSVVDFVVLGALSFAIVALLVFIVVYGESASARRRRSPKPKAPPPHAKVVQQVARSSEGGEDDITLITMSFEELQQEESKERAAAEAAVAAATQAATSPRIERDDDIDRTIPIVADPGADDEEPTSQLAMILVSAAGQSDRGRKRERNEDRFAVYEKEHLYVVADGMGGYAGGQIASQLACDTIVDAFREGELRGSISGGQDDAEVPRRAAELAVAVQMANRAVFERGQSDPELRGMGTTVVCARFAPKKRRLYIGHVGDSRCYRIRDGGVQQLTEDHTMARFGVTGRQGAALSRAVGIGPGVNVDLIIAEPRVDDVYLLCSDGLTKMLKDDRIFGDVVQSTPNLERAVDKLVSMANDAGGKDNVTVVLVAVRDAAGLRKSFSLTPVSPPRVTGG